MIFYNVFISCVLLLLYPKVAISSDIKKKALRNSDDNVKHTFAKLLKTIVRVNEERMDAVKKITQLQDYMLTKNKLKGDEDAYDSMEEDENRIVLAFGDLPRLRRTEDETMTRKMCNQVFLEKNNMHLWTKQFLKEACDKQSVSLCIDACQRSVLKICEKFQCLDKTWREFRIECHDNCKNLFDSDDDDSTQEF